MPMKVQVTPAVLEAMCEMLRGLAGVWVSDRWGGIMLVLGSRLGSAYR